MVLGKMNTQLHFGKFDTINRRYYSAGNQIDFKEQILTEWTAVDSYIGLQV